MAGAALRLIEGQGGPTSGSALERAEELFTLLRGFVISAEAKALKHSDFERKLLADGRQLLRELYQAHLDSRAPGEAETSVVAVEEESLTRERDHDRKLETAVGEVEVVRRGYGAEGRTSLHPLDAALNIPPDRYSLELRRQCALEVARGSYGEAVESIERTTGTRVAKRQMEELSRRSAVDFDAFYESRDLAEVCREIVVLSVDGKGIPMIRRDLRPSTRAAAEASERRPGQRLRPGEKRNRKRMATVATVYTVDPHKRSPEDVFAKSARLANDRPAPHAKRVWASVRKDPDEVIKEAFDEADARKGSAEATWVALVDGNEPQLDALEKTALERGIHLEILLDIVHVLEKLWAAGRAFHREGSDELATWVRHYGLEILRGRASVVAGAIRRSATWHRLSKSQRRAVDICASYLLAYRDYMRYDEALKAGLPIATGAVEGACRHLVKLRMDQGRWSVDGAEAVLRLRALAQSGDFDEYWRFHEDREYDRNHAALYADGLPPQVKKPARNRSKPILRRVK